MSQIIIGFTTEGPTDVRFLSSIIQRTFVEVGFECSKEVEVVEPVIYIVKDKGDHFNEQIIKCCQKAFENGVMAFCIHADADDESDDHAFKFRINPTFEEIRAIKEGICDNLVPLVPIQMTESWMLADKSLLKEEIGTEMNDTQLGLARDPESVNNPKEVIAEAIRIARQSLTRRRRKDLDIGELYQPIGQKISLNKLEKIPSYNKFKEEVRNAYRKLNYLQ